MLLMKKQSATEGNFVTHFLPRRQTKKFQLPVVEKI